MVQGPDATGELVARGIWIMFLDDLAKPGGLHSADRILHGISIEITKHKNRVISEGLVDPTRQCLSLGDAAWVRLTLVGAVILPGTLGLKVVDHRHEGALGALRLEALGQRLTGVREAGSAKICEAPTGLTLPTL